MFLTYPTCFFLIQNDSARNSEYLQHQSIVPECQDLNQDTFIDPASQADRLNKGDN